MIPKIIRTGRHRARLAKGDIVSFSNTKAQAFVDAWLEDVASLEDADDAEKLSFPETQS